MVMLMTLVGGLAIYQMHRGEGLTSTIRDNAIPCIQMAGTMDSILQHKRILVMKFITARTPVEIQTLESDNQQLNRQAEQLWQEYERLVSVAREREQLDTVKRTYAEYDQMMLTQLLPLVRAQDQEAALALTVQLKPVADRLTAEVQELIRINDEAAEALTQAMGEQNTRAIELIATCLAVAIAIGILLTVL